MQAKVLLAVGLITTPALANPQLFEQLRTNQTVTVVLPNAECEATVVRHEADLLTLSLKKTTQACGKRNSLVTLSRPTVDDIIDERPATHRRHRHKDPEMSRAGFCTLLGAVFIAAPASFAAGENSSSNAPGVAALVGGVALSAGVCYGLLFRPSPRYTIFTSSLLPATVP